MNFFDIIFGSIFGPIIGSPITSIYLLLCTVFLCALFQIFVLRKAVKKEGACLTASHFVLVYIFLFYLMGVYLMTGMGTIWEMGMHNSFLRPGEVYLIPFENFNISNLMSIFSNEVLNIVLMIPLGILLPMIWTEFRSVKKVALTGFVFSLAIEISQLINIRASTIDDLIMNTLGTIIGYLIFRCIYKIAFKDREYSNKSKSISFILRNEAIIYLICSFVGVFFLFNEPLPYNLMNPGWETNGMMR